MTPSFFFLLVTFLLLVGLNTLGSHLSYLAPNTTGSRRNLAHNSKDHKGFLCYGKALDAVDFVFSFFMKEIFFLLFLSKYGSVHFSQRGRCFRRLMFVLVGQGLKG